MDENELLQARAERTALAAEGVAAAMEGQRRRNRAAEKIYTHGDMHALKQRMTDMSQQDKFMWGGLGFVVGAAVALFFFSGLMTSAKPEVPTYANPTDLYNAAS